MFNMLNTGQQPVEYVKSVIAEVERVAKQLKDEASEKNKFASTKLVHEVTITPNGVRSNAHIRVNTTLTLDGKTDCQSMSIELEDGMNYSHDIFNELAEDCAAVVTEWMDLAVMCGTILETSDVSQEYSNRFNGALRASGVDGNVHTSVVLVGGSIQSITITVA